jgi:hypothetical protein
MKFRLKAGPRAHLKGFADDWPSGKRFTFAVVDLDRSDSYPHNFVCMLPLRLSPEGKQPETVFQRVFGDRSLEQAKALLHGALETEQESQVKAEIERRLKMLESGKAIHIRCSGCGKTFQPRRVRRYRQNFCEECMKKKYGSRD